MFARTLFVVFIFFFISCRPPGQGRVDSRLFSATETTDSKSASLTGDGNTPEGNSQGSASNEEEEDDDDDDESDNSSSSSEPVYKTYYFDQDGDGYGTPDTTTEDTSTPSGFVSNDDDCDDLDADINPGASEPCGSTEDKNCDGELITVLYVDNDGDGYGDSDASTISATETTCEYEDYSSVSGDCDDSDPNKNPQTKWYEDYDQDGSGDSSGSVMFIQCEDPSTSALSFASNSLDCDDNDPYMYDSDTGCIIEGDENDPNYDDYYADQDGDGYGDPDLYVRSSFAPNGYVTNSLDCDDDDDEINPDAIETCGETEDKNCDGFSPDILYPDADEDGYGDPDGESITADENTCLLSRYSHIPEDCDDDDESLNPETKWYEDYDDDGFGRSDGNAIFIQCEAPSSSVLSFSRNQDDCDDDNGYIYPDSSGDCTASDDDEDISYTFYYDADGDGYGDPNNSTLSTSQPTNYVTNNTDCDDDNDEIHPNAEEECGSTEDLNCDGFTPDTLYPDLDEDGYGDPDGETVEADSSICLLSKYSHTPTDCDDDNASISPETEWYEDWDNDGYGKETGYVIYTQCEDPSSSSFDFASNNLDCDDSDADIIPDEEGNCSTEVSEEDDSLYYYDGDGDGYGDPEKSKEADSTPTGYVSNDDDCDDSNSHIHPDATEVCGDAVDMNCDGFTPDKLYPDLDEDGYGDPTGSTITATSTTCLLSKYSHIPTDCNDSDDFYNPETEWYEDYDEDGYGKEGGSVILTQCEEPTDLVVELVSNDDDCDDDTSTTYPGAPAGCLVDSDCDGTEEVSHCEILETEVVTATNTSSTAGSTVSVACQSGWIMTGCTCHEAHQGCARGSFMQKEDDGSVTCNSINAENQPNIVTAQCIRMGNPDFTSETMTNYGISIQVSDISGSSDDNSTTVSCNEDYLMTGCSCYSDTGSCGDGAYLTANNKCFAKTSGTGDGVYAVATCILFGGEQTIKRSRKTGDESGTGDDSESNRECPASYYAVGCSCFTSYDACEDGARFNDDNGCTAYRDSSANTNSATVESKLNCVLIN